LESQISSISDDIAYNSHDLEDGLKCNLFKIEDIKDIPIISDIIKKYKKKINKRNNELLLRQIIRDIINEMVKDVVNNTNNNLKYQKIKSIRDIYESKIQLVSFSDKMAEFDFNIKNFLKKNMYYNKEVLKKTKKGEKIIKNLFTIINKKPVKFLKKGALSKREKERSICDFIAGMTDRYAINLYNSLT